VGRRTVTAWRRTDVGTHVIYVGSPAASAQVSPASNDAAAWYFDARTKTRWVGVSGSATIAELESGGSCGIQSRGSRGPTSSCTKAVFEVGFDVRFASDGTNRPASHSPNMKGISALNQRVNGAKLSS
jgi:hypothetical protein